MFVIRQAKPHDLSDLHSLAKQTYFINLPPERDIIAEKIEQSRRSFARLAAAPARGSRSAAAQGRSSADGAGIKALTSHSDLFLLVLEDLDGRGVIGTSQVVSRMGGRGHPRVALRLGSMTRRSESLKLQWSHQTAELVLDESGPTEIGGLILNHAFRGHKQRLGRLLSFVRFHLIGLFRGRFAPRLVAEMLGPIDKSGYNPFFEKFTRHFIPRSFAEVYRFSQTSKEFVTGLFPPSPIDLSIMDPEVAHAAGAVGEDTAPARRMLERLGFIDKGHIDPLDGGPHLEAKTDAISLIRDTRRASVVALAPRGAAKPRTRDSNHDPGVIISALGADGEFRAMHARAGAATLDARGRLLLARDAAMGLAPAGKPVAAGLTPLPD